MRASQRGRHMTAVLCAAILLGLAFWGPQAGLQAVEVPINLDHLDFLADRIKLANGDTLPIWWVYCEPTVSGDRNSPYKYVEAATEGVSCIDDVARAALVYLRHYELYRDEHSLAKAKDAFRFIAYMRTPEGHFYNFVLASGARNQKGATSVQGVNWWTARAAWALASGYRVFRQVDPSYAAELDKLLHPVLVSLREFLTGNTLSMYGQYKTLHGRKIPAWFVGDGSDASSVVVLALCELYEAKPDPAVAEMISMFAEGIAAYQLGSHDESPFCAHLPWGGSITNWHAWGSHQVRALAYAGRLLKNDAWIKSAEREANALYTHMLASIGHFAHLGPVPLTYVQISYGNEAITTGLLELYRATGKEIYAKMAGIAGSWWWGNNVADYPMYDPATGRGWDGIDPPGPERGIGVSCNAGAESTIESLAALAELAKCAPALDYLHLRTKARYSFKVIEAESFEKPVSGRPRKIWANWTGENTPSEQFYVTARAGDCYRLAFSLPEEDEFIPYVVYERQPVGPGQVVLSIAVDDGAPVLVDLGGSPDSKYFVMEKLCPRLRLPAGRHTVTVKFAGSSKTMAAALDALVLQPMVEWRYMAGPGRQNVLVARSFSREATERTLLLDMRNIASATEASIRISRYDADGLLTEAETIRRPLAAGAESLALPVSLAGFGCTIVEWR
ncbi:MAG: hypothetical protein ACM3ZC_06175 [Bacteroidota bacterium]